MQAVVDVLQLLSSKMGELKIKDVRYFERKAFVMKVKKWTYSTNEAIFSKYIMIDYKTYNSF